MKVALTITIVVVAVAIAYVGPQVAAHRDPTLVYLRESSRRGEANLIPAIFPANTHRSSVHAYFIERGFRGPLKMMRHPNGEFYADEGWSLNNLFWHYGIRIIYDDDNKLIKAWGGAAEPGTK
jgi:hypothetical protein